MIIDFVDGISSQDNPSYRDTRQFSHAGTNHVTDDTKFATKVINMASYFRLKSRAGRHT